ncbi:hypothetical protein RUM43_003361 [Polyplax serrata]|uniref:Uncharacterized protein n=1 Tax=Polyplax serrata TaxID=468196 RepID=A0AAN8S6G7_POLSC
MKRRKVELKDGQTNEENCEKVEGLEKFQRRYPNSNYIRAALSLTENGVAQGSEEEEMNPSQGK